MLLHLSGKMDLPGTDSVMRVFDLRQPPPPPLRPRRSRSSSRSRRRRRADRRRPNIRSEATPVQAPKPKIVVPPVPQIAASRRRAQGTAPTQGASDIAGTGTGAGGVGNGTGSGAAATGRAAAATAAVAEPPHLVNAGAHRPRFPARHARAMAGRRDRVPAPAGRCARLCQRNAPSIAAPASPSIDSAMCNLAHDRLRFRPALNRSGQPVAGWFGYAQRAPR